MVVAQSLDCSDPWASQLATARALELLAPHSTANDLEPFFRFLNEDQALETALPTSGEGCYPPEQLSSVYTARAASLPSSLSLKGIWDSQVLPLKRMTISRKQWSFYLVALLAIYKPRTPEYQQLNHVRVSCLHSRPCRTPSVGYLNPMSRMPTPADVIWRLDVRWSRGDPGCFARNHGESLWIWHKAYPPYTFGGFRWKAVSFEERINWAVGLLFSSAVVDLPSHRHSSINWYWPTLMLKSVPRWTRVSNGLEKLSVIQKSNLWFQYSWKPLSILPRLQMQSHHYWRPLSCIIWTIHHWRWSVLFLVILDYLIMLDNRLFPSLKEDCENAVQTWRRRPLKLWATSHPWLMLRILCPTWTSYFPCASSSCGSCPWSPCDCCQSIGHTRWGSFTSGSFRVSYRFYDHLTSFELFSSHQLPFFTFVVIFSSSHTSPDRRHKFCALWSPYFCCSIDIVSTGFRFVSTSSNSLFVSLWPIFFHLFWRTCDNFRLPSLPCAVWWLLIFFAADFLIVLDSLTRGGIIDFHPVCVTTSLHNVEGTAFLSLYTRFISISILSFRRLLHTGVVYYTYPCSLRSSLHLLLSIDSLAPFQLPWNRRRGQFSCSSFPWRERRQLRFWLTAQVTTCSEPLIQGVLLGYPEKWDLQLLASKLPDSALARRGGWDLCVLFTTYSGGKSVGWRWGWKLVDAIETRIQKKLDTQPRIFCNSELPTHWAPVLVFLTTTTSATAARGIFRGSSLYRPTPHRRHSPMLRKFKSYWRKRKSYWF